MARYRGSDLWVDPAGSSGRRAASLKRFIPLIVAVALAVGVLALHAAKSGNRGDEYAKASEAAELQRRGGCSGVAQADAKKGGSRKSAGARPKHKRSAFADLAYPTDADILDRSKSSRSFMPTAAGRPESAMYGSVRTGGDGRPRFHEGVDIAPQHLTSRGVPRDEIRCIAPGVVRYIGKVGGDSSYGVHVYVEHDDPVGPVYSLYAHLNSVTNTLRVGQRLDAGAPIGIMGNSGSQGTPLARSHLHLEIGMLLDAEDFNAWCVKYQFKPYRGIYHGWNQFSLDPVGFYEMHSRMGEGTSFLEYVQGTPVAVEIVLKTQKRITYFKRHPRLWDGPAMKDGEPVVLRLSEAGLILSGRSATEEEAKLLDGKTRRVPKYAVKQAKVAVLKVNEDALGRNGARLAQKANGGFVPASGLDRIVSILDFKR